jgi:phage gp36-like protein
MGIASNALGAVPSADRDVARATASSVATSYLKKQFTPPFTSVSDDVKRAVAHVAAYDLIVRRGFLPTVAGDPALEQRYLNAIQWLRDCAKGVCEPEKIVDSTPNVPENSPLADSAASQWRDYGVRRTR